MIQHNHTKTYVDSAAQDVFERTRIVRGSFHIELINGSENYVDASTIREVPDNQEVFVGKNDDTSILIDLLERVPENDLIKAMEYHLEDILYD